MKLSLETVNTLRQAARHCLDEISTQIKGKPVAERDAIARAALDKYVTPLAKLPLGHIKPRQWLVYYVNTIEKERLHGTASE